MTDQISFLPMLEPRDTSFDDNERKESHKKWQQSEAGKKSMHDRGERYRHTEKGVKNSRKKAMTYYYAHKDDPDFKAKRAARQRKYRA